MALLDKLDICEFFRLDLRGTRYYTGDGRLFSIKDIEDGVLPVFKMLYILLRRKKALCNVKLWVYI